jgi:hypothetical protein
MLKRLNVFSKSIPLHLKQKILVLYWYNVPFERMRLAIQQHIKVMESSKTQYTVTYHNVFNNTSPIKTSEFDAVILHTTFLCMRWSHLFYRLKWELNWIKDVKCTKIAIPQDEYDHSEILDEWLYELGVNCIFSCFGEEQRKILYPLMSEKIPFMKCLTGYIDPANPMIKPIPLKQREMDIVYRASFLPYWFGKHGQLKQEIAGIIKNAAHLLGLQTDISTKNLDTITGSKWMDFLSSGRAVIGCESGSSVLDRRGEIRAKIQNLLRGNPSMAYAEVARLMPAGWDDYVFFAISPRHFEAVTTKTCQILVEGSYNGILQPNLHYISLKQDFSNLDEVLDKIRDLPLLNRITEQAYEDIYASGKYTYEKFALEIDKVIQS